MPQIHIADLPELTRILSDEVQTSAATAMAERGLFSIALPGGSVATTCFPALAALAVDWTRTHFWWVDERAVPATDPESNFGLAERLWLIPTGVPAWSIHRMPADAVDLVAAAEAYGEELTGALGRVPVLDLVLLGMGPDGHVASLFPGHALLDEHERVAAAIIDAPKPPPHRLTLTLPILQRARSVVVAAFGASKATALGQALGDLTSELPVAQVLRGASRAIVLADDPAGVELRRAGSAGL
ncbi:MAG: 6-phosphogluconolactonase [Vicinamibacterales bacterium]